MDKNPTINVLVLADLLPQGEQLVSTLRRAGFRLHAEAVRDERWLRERLLSHRWELLCILANRRIPAQRVGAVLREMQPDLLCVTIGSAAAEAATATGYPSVPAEFPHLLDLPDVSNPDDPRQATVLIRTLSRELQALHIRRQWRLCHTALRELQGRHERLLDNISDAVTYLHDGIHVYVNAAYAGLFGHADPAALLNTAFLDLVDEAVVEEARDYLRQCHQNPQHRLRAVDARGLPLDLWLHCRSIVYEGEQALQVILRPVHGQTLPQPRSRAPQHSFEEQDPHGIPIAAPDPAIVFPQTIGQPDNDACLLHQRLQQALDHDGLVFLFQPIAGFIEEGLEHYSVSPGLPRDGDGDNGSPRPDDDIRLLPAHLLATASRPGLGEQIDRHMLSGCLLRLREDQRPGLRLVVPLSHGSLTNSGFLPWLGQQLQQSQVQSGRLVLQISELDIIDTPPDRVQAFCCQLQELQIRLSISDFGGSLDPFSYLPQHHATYVGLDPSLVDGIDADSDKRDRLQDTVGRLHASGLLVVSRAHRVALLPALWEARVDLLLGDCLQKADRHMDFIFMRHEEITLSALP